MESDERSFTVEKMLRGKKTLRTTGGRYISKSPSAAAKKAFSQYYRKQTPGKMTLIIHIRETTNDSSHKIFKYKISKVLDNKQVEKDGKIIEYKYKTKIKKI